MSVTTNGCFVPCFCPVLPSAFEKRGIVFSLTFMIMLLSRWLRLDLISETFCTLRLRIKNVRTTEEKTLI